MARDDRRQGAEDRPAAPAVHGRRPARLRVDGPALSELLDRVLAGYDAFNRGDFDAAVAGLHPEMEWVVLEDFPDPGPFRGIEGTRAFWELWKGTFDEFHAELEEYVEAEDAVIVMVRMVGRGKDSGVSVDTPTFPMVWTIRDGRAARMQMFTSRDEALASVGLPPDTPFTPI